LCMAKSKSTDGYCLKMKNAGYLLSPIQKEITDLWRYRWVCYSAVTSVLKMRYRRSVLGFFWSLLGPVLNYLIIGLVFSFLSKSNTENYFTFMFAGTAIFNLLSVTINQSPNIMISNENYIKKIYLPKSIFILNVVLMEFINFCLGLLALSILGIAFGQLKISPSLLYLPVPILAALFFNIGIASILSIVTVFFRDVNHILPIVMQAAFFGTPIVYPVELAPQQFHYLLKLNPFYYFVESFRFPIYHRQLPPIEITLMTIALSLLVFIIGIAVLKKFDNKIVFRL